MLPVIIIIVFVIVFGSLGAVMFILSRKTKKSIEEAKENGEIVDERDIDPNTTITELPFEEIKDSMIYLGDDEYRMVIECGSINLGLKTEEEQTVVEMSFQRCIQSLNFPFAFYVQTREIDNSKIIENTRRDAVETVRRFPFMENYANYYIGALNQMNETMSNTKLKKKYIIVTYNDLKKMKDIEENDKWDMAYDELETRCQSAIYALHNVGINAHIMDSNEIAEMIFRAYNKEGNALIEGMTSGEMTSLMVDSERHATQLDKIEEMDIIINEFFCQLETSIIHDKNTPEVFVKAAHQTIDIVNKMRDRVGGIYKTYPSSNRNGTLEEMLEDLDRIPTPPKSQPPRQPQSAFTQKPANNTPTPSSDDEFEFEL